MRSFIFFLALIIFTANSLSLANNCGDDDDDDKDRGSRSSASSSSGGGGGGNSNGGPSPAGGSNGGRGVAEEANALDPESARYRDCVTANCAQDWTICQAQCARAPGDSSWAEFGQFQATDSIDFGGK